MKSTGMVRKIDNLGRIVLPKELRRSLNIDVKDSLEIFVENDFIILRKYQATCILCRCTDDLIDFGGKKLCRNCVDQLKQEKIYKQ